MREWGHFRDSFESLITRNESLSNLDRFHYLISAVKGVPAQTTKKFPPSDTSFEAAWELLCGRYEDDDDDDEDNKLNNQHHRQQQQRRGAVHRTDEVSPAKHNLLSPTLGGGAGLIGVELDLLTNLPTLSNGKLLINNDAHKTSRGVEEKEEKVEIEDETAKAGVEVTLGIHDTVTSTTQPPYSVVVTPGIRRASTTMMINETRPVGRTVSITPVSLAAAPRQY
ncbi:hypothetical protein K0M31_016116 [Melipona bicolor]|uniref:Uncharacterized protein n=1 Tax=Melipona bicolor TaxID=60889 RepID=A0AA40G7R2_9HYME|nr:hypothetical protein K0M31_016116 [Melipona bicolor]